MRLAIFGDVVGRSGREAVTTHLPKLRRRIKLVFVVVNAENAAGGFGVTRRICDDLLSAGADVLTTGNHAYDQRDDISLYDEETRLLRPANFARSNPGKGAALVRTRSGDGDVLVVHLQGQRFMEAVDDPRAAVDRELEGIALGREASAILVDFHAEATSEKYSLGHHLDGSVSAVVGTHTHVPTADDQVLPRGTAYMSDLGMTGDYDSVIGMEKSEPLRRFQTKLPGGRMQPASGPATLCGLFIETDDATGLAMRAEAIRIGGRLRQSAPALEA
ncbi:MAG: TIGR00282 family metallophosphoesterase [Pseudomonadota bacterium]